MRNYLLFDLNRKINNFIIMKENFVSHTLKLFVCFTYHLISGRFEFTSWERLIYSTGKTWIFNDQNNLLGLRLFDSSCPNGKPTDKKIKLFTNGKHANIEYLYLWLGQIETATPSRMVKVIPNWGLQSVIIFNAKKSHIQQRRNTLKRQVLGSKQGAPKEPWLCFKYQD